MKISNGLSKPNRQNQNRQSQRGFVTTEFALGLGVLLLPVALLVTVLPTWSERQEMARVAAREAARAYVITKDANEAHKMVQQIQENYSLKDGGLQLLLSGDPRQRGASVTATVDVKVPITNIPFLNANADAFSFSENHTEVVDLYRSAQQ